MIFRFARPASFARGFMLTASVFLIAADRPGAAMRDLQVYDRVLTTIGYRLAASAGDLCRQAPLLGLAVQDLSQYGPGDRALAARTFGFAGDPLVLAVAAGGPAERAGIQPDDAILTIAGTPVPTSFAAETGTYRRVAMVLDLLDVAAQRGNVVLTLRRAGAILSVVIKPTPGCAARFQTRTSGTIDAVADGTDVLVDTGAMRFAGSEDEIAALVGHELSHVILRHYERLQAITTDKVAAIRATEDEADRLGVYVVDRAGYSTAAIIAFWQHYRRTHALVMRAPTHASTAQRIAVIEREIARIGAMKAAGQSPRPAFMASAMSAPANGN